MMQMGVGIVSHNKNNISLFMRKYFAIQGKIQGKIQRKYFSTNIVEKKSEEKLHKRKK